MQFLLKLLLALQIVAQIAQTPQHIRRTTGMKVITQTMIAVTLKTSMESATPPRFAANSSRAEVFIYILPKSMHSLIQSGLPFSAEAWFLMSYSAYQEFVSTAINMPVTVMNAKGVQTIVP